MAVKDQERKGTLREWITKVFRPSRETELESPQRTDEAVQPEFVPEDAPVVELSDELLEFLKGSRFEPLREALMRENITTIEQLKAERLWVFLNRHNLYPIAERLSVFDYIQDQLNPEPEDEEVSEEVPEVDSEEESVVEEPEMEAFDTEEFATESETIQEEENHPEPVAASVLVPPSAPKDPAEVPYFELYPLDPDAYRTFPTLDCGFSVRVTNRLMSNKIENVGALLEQSDAIMLAISGFGANSLKELHTYFEKLVNSGLAGISFKSVGVTLTSELIPFSHNLRVGDFAFTENHSFSVKSQRIIERYREAHDNVDQELIDSVAKGDPAAMAIIGMLEEFVSIHERDNACRAALEKIPLSRTNMLAQKVFRAYTRNEEQRDFFAEHSYKDATLEQFVLANADMVVDGNPRITKLLKWCEYNIVSEIEEFFDKQLEKDRVRRIFCGRAHGDTLAQLGDELGLTRERVRQLEAKVARVARDWFLRNRVIYKIFLDLGYDTSLSSEKIRDYIGRYGVETVSLLKGFSEDKVFHYYYDERLDLFSLEKPIDYDGMQEYIDSLPDLFIADKLDGLIFNGAEKFGFPEVLLRTVFDGSYRRTGDTYHRSRLTLGNVYAETMKKYYPNGIHIDDAEIEKFKQLAQDEFGIDLSDKNTHSVSTIIARISILCGRGRYILKGDASYLSEQLVERIRNYVENGTTPIMLFSSIFTEFEDELRAEGVKNRYHLQGILKELFGDAWYFKRDYVSTDPEATSFYEAVGSFIAKATSPVSKEEVFRQFPGITDIVINLAVSGSDTINLFGSYINASRLTLSENDIQYLRKKLEEALTAEEICYARDLYNVIRQERPGLLSRNFITAGFGLYSVLEYLFGNDYNFSRPFIAREGAEIKSILSVLKEMVAEADLIEISDITSFATEHNYPIPSVLDFANSCNETHLMINAQELATLEYIGVDEEIARKIEPLILDEVKEAIPISHLTCVGRFPQLKVEWNAWLIYSILKKWSKELDVGTSKPLFKITYPVVAPAGSPLEVEFDESISHNGELISADNLDNIEELIADYITEELGDIDEL